MLNFLLLHRLMHVFLHLEGLLFEEGCSGLVQNVVVGLLDSVNLAGAGRG